MIEFLNHIFFACIIPETEPRILLIDSCMGEYEMPPVDGGFVSKLEEVSVLREYLSYFLEVLVVSSAFTYSS